VIGRLRSEEDGMTMIVIVLVLMLLLTLSGAALTAAGGDLNGGRYDQDTKRAFAAAESGLQWYTAQFGSDPNYWTKCTTGTPPAGMAHAPVSDRWDGTTYPDPRVWAQLPGSNEYYTVELIPRTIGTPCSTASPEATLLDATGRGFRVRVTGSAGQPDPNCNNPAMPSAPKCPPRRSMLATLRRSSFLDFLYFTDFEAYDPLVGLTMYKVPGATTSATAPASAVGQTYQAWAQANCGIHHWQGRDDGTNVATFNTTFKGTPSSKTMGCVQLAFGDDALNGPVHTNDSLMLCGQGTDLPNHLGTVFGRTGLDPIEIANGNPNVADGGAVGSPTGYPSTYPCAAFTPVVTYRGTRNTVANNMPMPTSNAALSSKASGVYLTTGKTTIVLNGSTNQVKINGTNRAWPANGVIYVQNGAACSSAPGYDPVDPQRSDASCGDAVVSGTYSQPLTIAAANDVVINGDVCLSSCATSFATSQAASATNMLGLIGNNFVRVWHPVANKPTAYDAAGKCTSGDAVGTMTNVRIDAAILALNDSFMVDSFECGKTGPEGTLNINGAIVQKYRGGVGQLDPATGALASGYTKNYVYDDRFHARNPPQFLDPASTSWNIVRVNEQVPAR
jgi:type II secretory pathway pseudopilin PulG